jgi:hypothetical protein
MLAAAFFTRPLESRCARRARRAEFSCSRIAACREIRPCDALRLRLITLRATIPVSSTLSTPIQARPRVMRTTTPESGNPRTAIAARPTAIGTRWAGPGIPLTLRSATCR